jgi:hypothetical protein
VLNRNNMTFDTLVNLQTDFYTPRFRTYPGHWSLRRDATWAPEKCIWLKFDENEPQHYVLDGIPNPKNAKTLIQFALKTLCYTLGSDQFAVVAKTWVHRNGLFV